MVNTLGQDLRVSNIMLHCVVEDFNRSKIVGFDDLFDYDNEFLVIPPQSSREVRSWFGFLIV